MIPGNSLEWLIVGINGFGRKLCPLRYVGGNVCVGVSYFCIPLQPQVQKLLNVVGYFVGYQISESFI